MARKRMVTRTLTITYAEVMCVNVETAEVTVNEYEINGSYSCQPDKLLKRLKLEHETPTIKVVAIQKMHEEEVVYGMEEEKFMVYADVIHR